MGTLSSSGWMDALSRGDWIDALCRGGWMDALRSCGSWMIYVEVNGLMRYVGWLDGCIKLR